LRALEADGVAVRPGPAALEHAQDKGVMRARLDSLGVPCPRHRIVTDPEDAAAFAAETAAAAGTDGAAANPSEGAAGRGTHGDGTAGTDRFPVPVVLKTVRGGYDGKGVWVVRSREEAA